MKWRDIRNLDSLPCSPKICDRKRPENTRQSWQPPEVGKANCGSDLRAFPEYNIQDKFRGLRHLAHEFGPNRAVLLRFVGAGPCIVLQRRRATSGDALANDIVQLRTFPTLHDGAWAFLAERAGLATERTVGDSSDDCSLHNAWGATTATAEVFPDLGTLTCRSRQRNDNRDKSASLRAAHVIIRRIRAGGGEPLAYRKQFPPQRDHHSRQPGAE